jgi:TolB protein
LFTSKPSANSSLRCASALVLGILLSGCESASTTESIAFLAQENGLWQPWLMKTQGAPAMVTRLTEDVVRLSWFPNGRELLLDTQTGRLLRVDTTTGKAVPIDFPVEGVVDAVIGPDGRRIAYSVGFVDSGDRNDIWTYDMISREQRKVASMPGLQHDPVWSSDGSAIYFLSNSGPQAHDLWRVDLVSGNKEQLTVNDLYHFDPAVRNDGAIAFSGNRGGDYDLWIHEQGGQPQRITHDPALDAQPSWSPDGRALVFESSREGDISQLWRYTLSTKRLERLTALPSGARMPEWAPAGARQ